MEMTGTAGSVWARLKRDWTTQGDVEVLANWSRGRVDDDSVTQAFARVKDRRNFVALLWGSVCAATALTGGLWAAVPPALAFMTLAQRRVMYLGPAAEVLEAVAPAEAAQEVLHGIAESAETDPAKPDFSHVQMRGLFAAEDTLQYTERALGIAGACYKTPSLLEWVLRVPPCTALHERLSVPLQRARAHYGLPAPSGS